MKPEFLGVYQHREEFIFPRSLGDTELEENSHQANKKKVCTLTKKNFGALFFPFENSWHGEGLNADEVIGVKIAVNSHLSESEVESNITWAPGKGGVLFVSAGSN